MKDTSPRAFGRKKDNSMSFLVLEKKAEEKSLFLFIIISFTVSHRTLHRRENIITRKRRSREREKELRKELF